MRLKLWIGLGALLGIGFANGEEQSDALRIASNFHHTSWTAKDGVPGESTWLAQTTDGWLWLGGASGLTRFDGVTSSNARSPDARALAA